MASYSLGILGVPADNPAQPLSIQIDDAYAREGSQRLASRLNTPFLCVKPDGTSAWFTYDAERSIPGQTRVLKQVGP